MKKILLTQGKYALIDNEDFERVNQYKWSCATLGYAFTNPGRRGHKTYILMHRLINNTPKGLQTDHINGNKLDNRRQNLRVADHSQNKWNKPKQVNNKSGYKGVSKQNNKWAMQIKCRGKAIREYYYSKEEAALAYNKYAKQLFGKFAVLNKLGDYCAD